jgi:hypothetical protein
VPTLRTLFGARARPHRDRAGGPPRLAAVIETPVYDLTIFKVHFGRLTLKAYTKGEHVLRFEAIVHNTKELRCGRVLERFPEIVDRLAGMTERFCTMLDCVDVSFLPDQLLDDLPTGTQLGATRVGGIALDKPRIRAALSAVLALTAAPGGFTVADFTTKVRAMTGQADADYTIRQAAYDLRKLRGKHLIVKPGRTRRYKIPRTPPAPSPPCSPSATRSSAPSSPASAAHEWDANPRPGPTSTATTNRSASTCKPSSITSASQPTPLRHRQHFVDRVP